MVILCGFNVFGHRLNEYKDLNMIFMESFIRSIFLALVGGFYPFNFKINQIRSGDMVMTSFGDVFGNG